MADKKQTMLYGLLTSIASKITYDNTESGLTADNVQDAIDELGTGKDWSTTRKRVGSYDGKDIYEQTEVVNNPTKNTLIPLNSLRDATSFLNVQFLAEFSNGLKSCASYYSTSSDWLRIELWINNSEGEYFYGEGDPNRTATKITFKALFTID